MSWNLGYPEIRNASVDEVYDAIGKNTAPQPIKDYVLMGVKGLRDRHGEDVRVTITGHGHLCDGPSSYEITSATIDIRKSDGN